LKVFLSYASEDVTTAKQVCMALRGAGHEVFFDADHLHPSADYNTRIHDAIEASDAFVFLLSPNAIDAGSYSLTELRFARQKWLSPWGHVLPVMIADVPWSAIDPYLGSITVLRPAGNVAAETVDALARLPESAEVKAAAARWHSPLFALQAMALASVAVAWGVTALAFGAGAATFNRASLILLVVVVAIALPVLVIGAVRRRRDASVRTLGQAWRSVATQPGFGAYGSAVAVAGAAALGWPLMSTGQVTLLAPQDLELTLVDGPGPGVSLGLLTAGAPRSLDLPVGRHRIVYREPSGAPDELGVLDDVDVPPVWSAAQSLVVPVPPLQRFHTLRSKKD